MNILKQISAVSIIALGLSACSLQSTKVPENQFIGIWELKGRIMLDGVQISIQYEDNNLTGRIQKLNDNKYVKLLVDSNEVWISTIKRVSNYEFLITENLIGKELFNTYGLSTNQEFKAEFINQDTIGLAKETADPKKATIFLIRIK